MVIINISDTQVKILPDTNKKLEDIRTTRLYSLVVCKKTEVKYFQEVEISE